MKTKLKKVFRKMGRWFNREFLKLNQTPPLIPGPIQTPSERVSKIQIQFTESEGFTCPVWKEKQRIMREHEANRR